MNSINKVIEELKQERSKLDAAILALTELANGKRGRGRPPKALAVIRARAAGSLPGHMEHTLQERNALP